MMSINTTILERISSEQSLLNAWMLLNKVNKTSKGLSNVSIRDFQGNLKIHIREISKALSTNNYIFSSVKGVTIKKKDGNLRPLRIPEIKDRLVHKVLAIEFENLLSKKFNLDNQCSFAYQSGKGIIQAITEMNVYYQEGYKIILEADIVKFFPSVDSKALIQKVKDVLPDKSVDDLFERAMNQELGNIKELENRKVYEEHFYESEQGIPQGNALSPLLANICLSDFDQRMIDEGFKMVRYADDFIVLCRDKKQAVEAYRVALEELETKLKLKVYSLKSKGDPGEKISRILDPRAVSFSFLSVRFDGLKCWVVESKVDSLIKKIQDLSSMEIRKLNQLEDVYLMQCLIKMKNLLEGWIAAYYFISIEKQVEEIDKHINVELYKLFLSFNFSLQKKDLEKIKLKGKSAKRWGLSEVQRKFSGVQSCVSILTKLRSKNDLLETLVINREAIISKGLDKIDFSKSLNVERELSSEEII